MNVVEFLRSTLGLDGFGHMMPVESGSAEILKRCLAGFADATSAAG
jgi:hypothetical protein